MSDAISLTRDPIFVASAKQGATRKDVVAVAGQPRSTLATLNGQGVCYSYLLRSGRPFFVGFNKEELVVTHGMLTCQEAQQRGFLNSSEPVKPKY